MRKSGFMDMSFSWIFAILVGGMILFGAIYGVSKFSDTQERVSSAQLGTEFSNFLSPLETEVESGKIVTVTFPLESRVTNLCQLTSTFGRQGFDISEKQGNSWTTNTQEIYSDSRYVFSERVSQGKTFYSFSKPLEIPFKVADLIFLIPETRKYCFLGNVPRDIEKEIEDFENPNLLIDDCEETNSIKVCFGDQNDCDIKVYPSQGYLTKKGDRLDFLGDSLMYAAIFSDSETYECELNRLMYKTSLMASVYKDKAIDLSSKGCESNLVSDLSNLEEKTGEIKSSEDLSTISYEVDSMESKNKYSRCRLW